MGKDAFDLGGIVHMKALANDGNIEYATLDSTRMCGDI